MNGPHKTLGYGPLSTLWAEKMRSLGGRGESVATERCPYTPGPGRRSGLEECLSLLIFSVQILTPGIGACQRSLRGSGCPPQPPPAPRPPSPLCPLLLLLVHTALLTLSGSARPYCLPFRASRGARQATREQGHESLRRLDVRTSPRSITLLPRVLNVLQNRYSRAFGRGAAVTCEAHKGPHLIPGM